MAQNPHEKAKASLPRSKENLIGFVAARDVEKNPKYQPKNGLTWCNAYVSDLLADLEAPMPRTGMFAHQQIDWLASNAAEAAGWSECEPGEGQAFANLGQPVVVTYRNPKEPPKGHSHIALLVPTESTLKPRITQAGAKNFSDAELARGFGKLQVRYWWHL